MDVKAEYVFDAPVERVWQVLLDPASLAHCMPGCEELVPLGGQEYEATLSVGVGAVRGTFKVTITLADQVPMRSYTLAVEGKGSPGFVRGQGRISLEPQGQGTLVRVEGEAQVGGTIARVGQRLLSSVNKMMLDRFFACLNEQACSS